MPDLYYCWHFEDTGKQGGHCGVTECLRIYGGGAQHFIKARGYYVCDECHACFESGELHKLPDAPRMTREEVMCRLASHMTPETLERILKEANATSD